MSILVNTGFKVGSAEPLNELSIRETVADRDALVTDGFAYEGMKVYCKDTQTEYRWTGTDWETVGSGSGTAIDDTQASDTTTYSSNKITDLIAEATAGKDLGNLLIANNESEMYILATKDNLGKSVIYVGDDTSSYTKGETYELYWNAITINYLNFAYSPSIKFDFKKIQEILGTRTSLTVTGQYGYQGQAVWNITTNIGMSGGGLSRYGITSLSGAFTVGDKFNYTYDDSKKDSYKWIPVYTKPSRILKEEWYNIDTPIIYDGVEGVYKRGRIYKLSSDNITVSSSSAEISNLTIDKKKFINNCDLRGNITFTWNSSGEYFTKTQDYYIHNTQYTKEKLNSWGITYDGDITTNGSSIVIKTSKDTSINNWEWKDVTDIVEVPTKTSELTNDSNYVKSSDLSTVATSGSYNDLTDKPTMPPGVIFPFAGSVTPVGYLLCDGSAVSRTDYPYLFAAIGTTYGVGDGSTTFNLPNLKDKFIQGSGTNAVGTEMSAGLPNITGEVGYLKTLNRGNYHEGVNLKNGCFNSSRTETTDPASSTAASYDELDTNSKTGVINLNASNSNSIYGNSNTVQPPAIVMQYIIKY